MHVALKTTGTLFSRIVKMVFSWSVLGSQMTAVTESISIHIYLAAVRLMTILAYHTGFIHLALKEGSIYIDLIFNLTVRKIEVLFQQ